MEEGLKNKLVDRNNRIINAVVEKANKVCPGAIALIGLGGSFLTGDFHEKSDLDLCIVINNDSGWKIGKCFIMDDVGFDIYCTPWSKLEYMADYNDPYITNLINMKVVYCSDDKYLNRFLNLRNSLLLKLEAKLSLEDVEKGDIYQEKALIDYGNIMLSNTYGEAMYNVALMVNNIEFAIFMYNKEYIRRGVKRIPEEIIKLKELPIDFIELYFELFKTTTLEAIKVISSKLMKAVKNFSKQLKDRLVIKKDVLESDIRGTYEEIHSNWRNKLYHAIDRKDNYLSLMATASCQMFYDEMYNCFNIERIDLFENFVVDDINLTAKEFDKCMEKYKINYKKVELTTSKYDSIESFERDYLQE